MMPGFRGQHRYLSPAAGLAKDLAQCLLQAGVAKDEDAGAHGREGRGHKLT